MNDPTPPPAPTPGPPTGAAPDAPPPVPTEPDMKGGTRAFEKRLRALEKQAGGGRPDGETKDKTKEKEKDKEKAKRETSRGVETMFRSAYRVNMDLSALADSKANMLVSVTGLLISIVLGTLAPGLDTNPWLRVPTAVFLLFLTVAFIFGVLASRPRVESRHVTLDDVRNRRANLLFFGHFANMPRDEFVVGMRELMQDPDALYHTMAVDLYGVGTVLQRKYRLLRVSFTVLLVGMGVGVLLFIGTFAIRTPNLRTVAPLVPAVLAPAGPVADDAPLSPYRAAPTDTVAR